MPLVGGLIGWGTNWLAVRMLFWPHRPWRIPLVGWQVQGVIPRRQANLANALGQAVEGKLLAGDDLLAGLRSPLLHGEVAAAVVDRVSQRIHQSLPGWVPSWLASSLTDWLGVAVRREVADFFNGPLDKLLTRVRQEMDVAALVEARVMAMAVTDLEELILGVMRRELRTIEWLGGVLGFVVGWVQVLLLALTSAR